MGVPQFDAGHRTDTAVPQGQTGSFVSDQSKKLCFSNNRVLYMILYRLTEKKTRHMETVGDCIRTSQRLRFKLTQLPVNEFDCQYKALKTVIKKI